MAEHNDTMEVYRQPLNEVEREESLACNDQKGPNPIQSSINLGDTQDFGSNILIMDIFTENRI